MIHKKLVLTNTIIIALTLAIITTVSVFTLRRIVFQENSLLYGTSIDNSYNTLNKEFAEAEDYVLHVCTSWNLINLLNQGLPDRNQLREAVSTIYSGNEYESLVVLPVIGQDVYVVDEETGEWEKQSNVLRYYPHDYEFEWHFRPDSKPCYRVMKAMHSQTEENEVIAIVYVDVALTTLADQVYGFGSYSNFKGDMFLLDEDNDYLIPYHLKGRAGFMEEGQDPSGELLRNDRMVTVRTFPQNGWKLATVIYESVLYKMSSGDLWMVYGGSAVLGLLAIVVTSLLTRRITRPILDLAGQMQQSGQQEKYNPLPIPADTEGEARVLYDSYNHLIDEVNQSIANIQEFSRKEQENQFMLLQAQINPHFLYNTLNTISWLAQNNQDEDIQSVVVALVRLFRTSLNNGKPFVTVQQELDNVSSYLKIMQFRYPDRYDIEINTGEGTEELIIIKQILQPLAENALTHGFLETEKAGRIIISSKLEGDQLVLTVANTGAEIDLDIVTRLLNNDPELSSQHYGIRNVNDRLQQYYGSGLQYKVDNGMTVVTISLPLNKVRETQYGQ